MSKRNFDYNIADSILVVKASDNTDLEANQDLHLQEGKSIADLLNDEKNIIQQKNQSQEKSENSTEENEIGQITE